MDLLFGTYWSLPGVRLLSSDDKVRSRFTQQGCTAHLTLSSACFLVAGAFQTDRDRIGFSHLHALLRLLAAFLSGLSNSAEPCPEVRGPMLWNQRPTRGARCSRKGLGPLGGRGTCEPGQERTWSRRKRGRRLARGVTKKCFMLPEYGHDLGAGIRHPGMGLDY